MRLLVFAASFVTVIVATDALKCWVCDNARSNLECLTRGRLWDCQENQKACQTEVRRDPQGMRISKRCKQALACDNNYIQNPRSAWFPSQCSDKHGSVCRCCCDFDNCNTRTINCETQAGPSCTRPDVPVNGAMSCPGNATVAPGGVCSFTCNAGFNLTGSAVISCNLINQTLAAFDQPPPTCAPMRDTPVCQPRQSAPQNGSVSCTNTNKVGSICTFSCGAGYYLTDGRNVLICGVLGEWSSTPPRCAKVTCPPAFVNPTNGLVTCTDGINDGSVCSFSCAPGYSLVGSPTSSCADDVDGDAFGVWSQPAPVCQPITCLPRHANPVDGNVTCLNDNNLGSDCFFSCKSGYRLVGAPISTCNDDGNGDTLGVWSQPAPVCEPIQCIPPHVAPVNGQVSCTNGNLVGSRCDFICSPGYAVTGNPISLCNQINIGTQAGAWSSPAPTCQPITCIPQQTPPLNGLVSCTSGNSIGSVCTFVCSPGYTLTGSGSTTCNDDFDGDITGVWSTPPPTCRQNDCSPPHSAPLHGSVSCSDGVQVGSQCEFGCDFGYATVGSSLSSCDALNGSEPAWSHPAPVCIQVTCVPPQAAPTNGQVSCTNANNADSVCTFQCDGGYQMSGSASTTCNDDFDDDVFGIWTNPAPTCSRQQCSPPHTNPSNGSVSCSDGSNLGSQCEFACQLGFTLIGAALSSCAQSNGNPPDWTAPAPICTPVVCTEQRAPINGGISCTNSNFFASVCSFQCSPGYAITGSTSNVCNDDFDGDADGVWSSPAPTCEPIVCVPHHLAPLNGRMTCTNDNREGSVCTFTCDATFSMEGSPQSTCQDDFNGDALGLWTSPAPQCTPIICLPVQSNPGNGSVQCTNSNFMDSTCSFTCNDGYVLVGSTSTSCTVNSPTDAIGFWTQPAPVCVARQTCNDPPSPPENGFRTCSDGNYVGSICSYGCNDLYVRVGSQFSTCLSQADGTASFDNPAPICQRLSCRDVQTLPNGNVSCSDGNYIDSVCTYQCDAANSYSLFPVQHNQTTCLADTTWDLPPPCCARQCPPYALMDFVMILDSSSSVKRRNWRIMKEFGKTIFNTFHLAEDAARMAAFRYNRVVDTRSQILFNQHINDKAGFLRSYDRIPYNGGGTLTGQALRHAKDVILANRNGNRPHVKDVVLTITDGRSHDDVKNISRELREMGVLTFVIGIVPGNGKQLDEVQLLDIAGSRSNMFLATSGFSGLDGAFSARLSESICTNPCGHLLLRDNTSPTNAPVTINGENVPSPSGK